MSREGSFPWFGVLLVLVGGALLLDRLAVLHLEYGRIMLGAAVVFGMYHVVRGFSRNRNGSIFWGTVLFLYGVYFFVRTFALFEFPKHLFFPASVLIFGVAIMMVYLNNLKEWFLIVPGVFLTAIGTILLLGRLELYDVWELWEPVRLYWPVVMILTGVAILLSGKLKRRMS